MSVGDHSGEAIVWVGLFRYFPYISDATPVGFTVPDPSLGVPGHPLRPSAGQLSLAPLVSR